MHEGAARVADGVTLETDLEQEFEARLVEGSTLAVRVAYAVLRNRADAEDVAQEALTKAYRNFRQLRDRARFRAWLVRMTWRMALDFRRGDRRREQREAAGQLLLEPAAGVADPHRQRERAQLLWHAIDGLSDKLRIVIVLAGIEGHDVKEIAALLDLPEGTVKSRPFAARQQLKEALSWIAGPRTTW